MAHTDRRNILLLTCLIILSLGVITAAIGPLLPEIAANNGVSLTAVGSILTVLFLGALVAQLVAGPLSDRVGEMPVMIGSTLLLAVGAAGIGAGRWLPLTLGMAFLAGLGHGAVDLCANVLIARLYPQRSASALSLTNLFFGVGAFGGPALASLLIGRTGSGLPVLWLTMGLLLIQAGLIYRQRDVPARFPRPVAATQAENGSMYRSLFLWLLGMLILLYVGAENGVGSWITAYMSQTTHLPYETATLVASAYWLALTLGRLTNSVLTLRLTAHTTLGLTLVGALGSVILIALSTGNSSLSSVGVFAAGFFFGAIYPCVMSITLATFTHSPGRAVSVVTSMGSVGGMLLPWLQGWLLEQISPSAYTSGLLVIIAVSLSVYLWLRATAFRKISVPAPVESTR